MANAKPIYVVFVTLSLLLACSKINASDKNYSLTPVLLVHGSGLSSRTWSKLQKHLIYKGYPEKYIHTVDLMPNNGRNIIAAQTQLKPAVDQLLLEAHSLCIKRSIQTCNTSKVDIVAHSMGAVSSRWYAARIHPEKVRKFISIAGSNHGTNALCGLSGEGNREMCPAYSIDKITNSVQVLLNDDIAFKYDETPYGIGYDMVRKWKLPPSEKRKISYYTVRIEPDMWIVPAKSAILEGAGGKQRIHHKNFQETSPGNYKYTQKAKHDYLPENTDVIVFVHKILVSDN